MIKAGCFRIKLDLKTGRFQNKSSQVMAFWIYLPSLTYCNIWTVFRGEIVTFCLLNGLFCLQNVSYVNF